MNHKKSLDDIWSETTTEKMSLDDIWQETALKQQPDDNSTWKQRAGIGGTPEQRTFFGIPKQLEKEIFPRASETQEKTLNEKEKPSFFDDLKKAASGSADFYSLPGRAIASLPSLAKGGETYSEALQRKTGKEGTGISGFVGTVLRDPALIPASIATGGMNIAGKPLLSKVLSGAGAGLREGITSSGVHQLEKFGETGRVSPKEAAIETATSTLAGGAASGIGALIDPIKKATSEAVGDLFKKAGEKIEISTLKPSKRVIKDVYVKKGENPTQKFIDNVFKYGLDGDIDTALKKINGKFDDLSSQLSAKIKASDAKIDIEAAFARSVDKLTESPSKSFGSNKDLEGIVKNILGEIQYISPDGIVSIADAQNIKRAVGTKGAWVNGLTDPEAAARQKVYNAFYSELKQEIEKNAPDGVKEINRQLSDLMPIEQAIIERIPVKTRNDMVSLTDVIGTTGAILSGPKGWAIPIVNKMSKSPRVGSKLYETGESMVTKKFESGYTNPLQKDLRQIARTKAEEENRKKRGLSSVVNLGRHY